MDARGIQLVEPTGRVDKCRLLIPVGLHVLDDFGVQHEDVFVHQRGTEFVGGDGAAQSLHVGHDGRLAP